MQQGYKFDHQGMFSMQGIPQMSPHHQKLMRDAAQQALLPKQPKKTLQQIAQELNINTEKTKKEDIANKRIPEEILKIYYENQNRGVEQIIAAKPVLRTHEILGKMLRIFTEAINKHQIPAYRAMPIPSMYLPQQVIHYPFYYNLPQQRPQYFYQYPSYEINPNTAPTVPIIPQNQSEKHIICTCKFSKRQNVDYSNEVKCLNCSQLFHSGCLRVPSSEQKSFECPACILNKFDPLNPVIKAYVKPQLMDPQLHSQLSFLINLDDQNNLQDKNTQIELRSIRLDYKYMHETTWPDFCEISLNQQKLAELKPLKTNSSLKKRKDDVQTLQNSNSLKQGYNLVQIKDLSSQHQLIEPKSQYKIAEDAVYAYAIYLTKHRQPSDLINWIKQNCTKPRGECLELIEQACLADRIDQDVQIDKITVKVSFKCQFDYHMIQTPARGKYCRHIQCFSLENTITMIANCNPPRKWKCPICKKKIFDMEVDSYQLELLEKYRKEKKKIKEVVFDQNGAIQSEVFDEPYSSDEEEAPKPQPQVQPGAQVQHPLFLSFQQLNQKQLQQSLSEDPSKNPMYLYNLFMHYQKMQQFQQKQAQPYQHQPAQNYHPNKQQLRQLVETNMTTIKQKSEILQSAFLSQNGRLKAYKPKRFDQWTTDSTNIDQESQAAEDKTSCKKIKSREKLVKVIKSQFKEFIKRNLNAQEQKSQGHQIQTHQSASKKTVFRLSDESSQMQNTKSKVGQINFQKQLANVVIAQNPNTNEKAKLQEKMLLESEANPGITQHSQLHQLQQQLMQPHLAQQGLASLNSNQQDSQAAPFTQQQNQPFPIIQPQQLQHLQQLQQLSQSQQLCGSNSNIPIPIEFDSQSAQAQQQQNLQQSQQPHAQAQAPQQPSQNVQLEQSVQPLQLQSSITNQQQQLQIAVQQHQQQQQSSALHQQQIQQSLQPSESQPQTFQAQPPQQQQYNENASKLTYPQQQFQPQQLQNTSLLGSMQHLSQSSNQGSQQSNCPSIAQPNSHQGAQAFGASSECFAPKARSQKNNSPNNSSAAKKIKPQKPQNEGGNVDNAICID